MIGLPPSSLGAFHETVIDVSVAASRIGASVIALGIVAQVKYYEFDSTEIPIAFVA